MIDRFTTPLFTPLETARHLQIPERTVRHWLSHTTAGHPLVHGIPPVRPGHPSVPFIALVEAYVLQSLRNHRLSPTKIADAAAAVREQFNTEYGLANRRIATDGVDVFVHHLETDELARVADRQPAFGEIINDDLRYIQWEDDDDFPARLTLRIYDPATTNVVIDPRYAWGAPVVETAKVPVSAVLGMWRAGEPVEVAANEYGLDVEQVQTLVRVAA